MLKVNSRIGVMVFQVFLMDENMPHGKQYPMLLMYEKMKNYLPKANDKEIKGIVEDKPREEFIESLRISEGEDIVRDANNELVVTIYYKSQHKYTSGELFQLINEIMIEKIH